MGTPGKLERTTPPRDVAGRRLIVTATDYHTAGEPFRIVTGGVEPIPGRTILEKRRYCAEHLDHVRQLLIHEPRGHADMYGCFVTEPEDEGADLGVVFFHNAGYSTACGHGTIALATAALETGMFPTVEPETKLVLDAPSGRLPVTVAVEEGRVGRVRFVNVPAFVAAEDLEVEGLAVDVAFGGAFYASVESPEPVGAGALPRLIERGRLVKRALDEEREWVHPLEPELRGLYGVIFWQREEGAGFRQRNVTVFADGEVDRSPCGSGTSARLALLDRSGELPRGEVLIHAGVVGTEFEGRVVADAEVGGLPAVVTEITGEAHLTGRHEFVLEPDDSLGTGFLLR
jgi:proline racemase